MMDPEGSADSVLALPLAFCGISSFFLTHTDPPFPSL